MEFTTRTDFVLSLLSPLEPGCTIADVGFAGDEGFPDVHAGILRGLEANSEVIGVDLVPSAVARAREQIRSTQTGTAATRYLSASIQALPFSNGSVDAVLALEVLEHLINPSQAISEAHRVLRKGGRLIVTTPNPLSLNRFVRFFFQSDAYGMEAIAAYRGDAKHKMLLHPQGLVMCLSDLGFSVKSLEYLKWRWNWMSRMRPTRRMSGHIGIAADKE